MSEPPLPARESFSYLGLSLSLSLTLLRVPPPSCPQRRRCTSSKETALDTRYERIIEIDRGRSTIVGEREKPEKLGFTLDPIHRLFQLRTSIGWIKKIPDLVQFSNIVEDRSSPSPKDVISFVQNFPPRPPCTIHPRR